jgi:hypothetical protein
MAKKAANEIVTQNLAQEIEEMRKRLLAPTGNKIKIENKQFKLPSGDVSDSLDVVIIDFVYMNKYYESEYDPNNIVPPTCFAINLGAAYLAPSPNSPNKQNKTCAGCPMNQFGTAGKGKACQNRMLIAVLPADATNDTPMHVLDISPTAIKPFSAYVSAVARTLNRPAFGVVTNVVCNPSVKWDVPVFGNPQLIEDADYIVMARSRRQEACELLCAEPDIEALRAANDAPKPRALITKQNSRKVAGSR